MDKVEIGQEINAEQRIIEAARQVFLRKGFSGARMQEIADGAGINKALVHYYFRSKDRLFEVIFNEAFGKLLPAIANTFKGSEKLIEKIEKFTATYIAIIQEHPYIPVFVLSEMHRNPENFFQKFIQPEMKEGIKQILSLFADAVHKGEIAPINPLSLMTNMMGLCVFPYLARPMLQRMLDVDDNNYEQFLQERKNTVSQFIIQAITPK